MIVVLFFSFIFLVIFNLIGYPFLLWFLPSKRYELDPDFTPTITILISAFNEEKIINKKIKNSLDINYPSDLMQILVVSDGSTDNTDNIARSFKEIDFIRLKHQGKTNAQNEAIKSATGEIIIFSDANSIYEPNAVEHLVKWFYDPMIGCVCGELKYDKKSNEGLYWKYEKILKLLESRIGKLLGANGGIYAIRKSDYITLPIDSISDFVEPLLIFGNGKDIVFEEDAKAIEPAPIAMYSRKRRIILRTITSLKYLKSLINPFNKRNLFFHLLSHKILRWSMPFLLIGILSTNIILTQKDILFEYALYCQIAFYLTGFFISPVKYFIIVNIAVLMAIIDSLRGKSTITWQVVR